MNSLELKNEFNDSVFFEIGGKIKFLTIFISVISYRKLLSLN